MVRSIRASSLVPHPERSNHGDAEFLKKLRRHIEETGVYEPLTVRPHPVVKGKFQVINGHSRLRVLVALGHKRVRCTVWDVNDAQTQLYLLTLNRLSGSEISERRASLLDSILQNRDAEELASLLPDNKKRVAELMRLARIELDDVELVEPIKEGESKVPVILSFILDESEAKEIELALDVAVNVGGSNTSRAQAQLELARSYLANATQRSTSPLTKR